MQLKNKTVFMSLIMLLVALLSVAALSYAWLASNKEVESQKHQMQIESMGVQINTFKVYRYDYQSNSIIELTTDTDIYRMTPYDSIFTQRNGNTALLFEITLQNVPERTTSINMTIGCDGEVTTFPTAEGYSEYEVPEDVYTSNVVYFRAATKKTITEQGASVVLPDMDNFQDIIGVLNEYGAGGQFLTATKSGNTYNFGTKAYTLTVPMDVWASERTDDGNVTVFLMFDYDETLLEAQLIDDFGHIDISGYADKIGYADDIVFQNDITEISFENVQTINPDT